MQQGWDYEDWKHTVIKDFIAHQDYFYFHALVLYITMNEIVIYVNN